ncbi:MAG: GNAT family N-acetyltransferase [Alphaproteobacteria bacterium]|nr:MAG: GNAT family N-acetyltransferase [Alphaproteobacteria bacterium]
MQPVMVNEGVDMSERAFERRVHAMRRFTRFYTAYTGSLDRRLLRSPFSLAEARVLYELAHGNGPTAAELAVVLGLDAGYLSRILRRLEERGLIARHRSARDRRQAELSLTRSGRAAFADIDARASEWVGAILRPLAPRAQEHLITAMKTVERLLAPSADGAPPPFFLRPHHCGDFGWIIHRHAALCGENGLRASPRADAFEAALAQRMAEILRTFDADRERCWVADMDGEIAGTVCLIRWDRDDAAADDTVARLCFLLVEPHVRGLGIGRRLVETAVQFARAAGYRTVMLSLTDDMPAARHIFATIGFHPTGRADPAPLDPARAGEIWECSL